MTSSAAFLLFVDFILYKIANCLICHNVTLFLNPNIFRDVTKHKKHF